jgi:hypothetical protein
VPQVPTYDGPRLAPTALRPVYQNTPDVSGGAQVLARTMGQLGEVVDRQVVRDAETEAWQAQAKIADEFDKWDTAERQRAQGANARDYRAKVDAWWAETQKTYGATLSPLAQRAIGKSLAAVRNSTLKSAGDYETQQLELGARSALDATVNSLVKQAIKAGPDGGAPIVTQAAEQVRSFYNQRGLDGASAALKVTTGAHVTVINQLMQRDPKAAELYFNTHKEQIDPTSWDDIGGRLNQVSAVTDGEAKATELWAATVKPGDYKNPVDLFALEKQAREAFPNDPTRQRAAIQSLREMTTAWNKSQQEMGAANTNSVYGMLDQGVPLTRVMRSKQWNDLPEPQQRQIRLQLEQEAAARESRAAASEQRALAAEQRRERQLLMTNSGKYLEYTDPTKLAGMSRVEVQALRSEFGFEATKHLLDRWDTIQKPGKVAEARMDTEDFNRVARDLLGYDQYTARTPQKKSDLGDLKYRVEQVIDMAQRQKGKELTRDEKAVLMKEEMARTVTVGNFLLPNETVPVIQLTLDQVKKVVVPTADRTQIIEALKTMSARDPKNPLYAPTEDNVRRLYLANRSRAAALIPAPK